MTLLAILCMKKSQDCQKMPHCRLSAPKIAHFWTLAKTDLGVVDSYKPVYISCSCTDNITGSKKQGVQVKEILPMLILFNDPQDLPRHKNDITALVNNHHLTCSGVQFPLKKCLSTAVTVGQCQCILCGNGDDPRGWKLISRGSRGNGSKCCGSPAGMSVHFTL